MSSRAFVKIYNIVVIPLYVKLSVTHSPYTLTASTIAIEDEWLVFRQSYWSIVVTIAATTIFDGSVMTVDTIWQYTPFPVLVE